MYNCFGLPGRSAGQSYALVYRGIIEMHREQYLSLVLAGMVLLSFGGCNKAEDSDAITDTTAGFIVSEGLDQTEMTQTETSETSAATTEITESSIEFNPHVYVSKLSTVIPQDHWESFYNLCDALRAGEDTFECSSQEAYDWATDPVTLNELFPAACMRISGKSDDGSVPFENGVGRIYYQMPVEEYVARQAEFEAIIADVLNTYLEPDDNDFEKCLKLYDYMESTYFYEEIPQYSGNGASYYTIMNRKGVCYELSSVYSYLLLQVGVDALNVGCYAPGMDHAWTYVVVDGVGYHVDATWSLKSYLYNDDLCLEYFMMTDDNRTASGCPVDDLTVPLLPGYWVKFSTVTFEAPEQKYHFSSVSRYRYLDEDEKILYYDDSEGLYSVSYA